MVRGVSSDYNSTAPPQRLRLKEGAPVTCALIHQVSSVTHVSLRFMPHPNSSIGDAAWFAASGRWILCRAEVLDLNGFPGGLRLF